MYLELNYGWFLSQALLSLYNNKYLNYLIGFFNKKIIFTLWVNSQIPYFKRLKYKLLRLINEHHKEEEGSDIMPIV